jgi:Archaeal ATPase.
MATIRIENPKLRMLADLLVPSRPITKPEFLRGRNGDLERVIESLQYSDATLFIFGERGVGKTSLAKTAVNEVSVENNIIYSACAPDTSMISIFNDVAHKLTDVVKQYATLDEINNKLSFTLSLTPSVSLNSETKKYTHDEVSDVNSAVRVLKKLDSVLPESIIVPVILDEIETLSAEHRSHLAHLIKQIGDQDFKLKLILVGIGDNVQELIGEHGSVPRYIEEVRVPPLCPQDLIDIVKNAANSVEVDIRDEIYYRIAVIGDGYPHFAHLLGKMMLSEAIKENLDSVSSEIYQRGLRRAVESSIHELTMSYEKATQRGDDHYRNLLWALADNTSLDIRIDDWLRSYKEFCSERNFEIADEEIVRSRIQRLSQREFGAIITNTPRSYGSRDKIYRYKRFSNSLMKSHVRLVAEAEGYHLGSL